MAIDNAKALSISQTHIEFISTQSNPSTLVFKLVEHLNEI